MKLSTYIQTHLNVPFEWGRHDCCTFVGGWVEIKTGRDYLIEHRPWRTAKEAVKKLRALNGLFSFLDSHFTSIDPRMAQDGDLAIANGVLCLFSGRHVVSAGISGLAFEDRVNADCAWTYKCRH